MLLCLDLGGRSQGEEDVDGNNLRNPEIGDVTEFRVRFEIDLSGNNNIYFYDRPAYPYESGLIDPRALQSSYDLDPTARIAANGRTIRPGKRTQRGKTVKTGDAVPAPTGQEIPLTYPREAA